MLRDADARCPSHFRKVPVFGKLTRFDRNTTLIRVGVDPC